MKKYRIEIINKYEKDYRGQAQVEKIYHTDKAEYIEKYITRYLGASDCARRFAYEVNVYKLINNVYTLLDRY